MYSLALISNLVDAVKRNIPLPRYMGTTITTEKKFDGTDTLIRVCCIQGSHFQWDIYTYENRPIVREDLSRICVNKTYGPDKLSLINDYMVAYDPQGLIDWKNGAPYDGRPLNLMSSMGGMPFNQMAGFGANPYGHPVDMRFGDAPFPNQFGDWPTGPQFGVPAQDSYPNRGFNRTHVYGHQLTRTTGVPASAALLNLMGDETKRLYDGIMSELTRCLLDKESWTYTDGSYDPVIDKKYSVAEVPNADIYLLRALITKQFRKLGYEIEVITHKDENITVRLSIAI